MKDKISIIVPVYNVEAYLERCIESIINQTYKNLEIILVNDGSTDNSKAICEQYVQKDSRIVLINQKNGGSSIARNVGLDKASGNIIAFADSDDYLEELMLETMVNAMTSYNLDVVEIEPYYTGINRTFDNSLTIQDRTTAIKRILSRESFAVWRRIYRKSIIDDMRFIPKIIHQDVFFTIDLVNRISKIGYINTPFYLYNIDNISIIRSKYTTKKIDTGIRATEYIINNLPKNKIINKALNNYVVYYYTGHYFQLTKNKHVDPLRLYRKKLKKGIFKALNFKNVTLRSLIIVLFPVKFVEILVLKFKIK